MDQAITQGAQIVTLRGKKIVAIISWKEYQHLSRQKGSLVQFLLASPLPGPELIIERNKTTLHPG